MLFKVRGFRINELPNLLRWSHLICQKILLKRTWVNAKLEVPTLHINQTKSYIPRRGLNGISPKVSRTNSLKSKLWIPKINRSRALNPGSWAKFQGRRTWCWPEIFEAISVNYNLWLTDWVGLELQNFQLQINQYAQWTRYQRPRSRTDKASITLPLCRILRTVRLAVRAD